MTKKELAEVCAKSERYIGTEGGGMDQAIACMATEGICNITCEIIIYM
jgi:N-acetylgalactosamine kinase